MQRCICLQVNNGVYKSGFATTQSAYDRAQRELYATLDRLERRLQDHDFLVGDRCGSANNEPCQAACHLVVQCAMCCDVPSDRSRC